PGSEQEAVRSVRLRARAWRRKRGLHPGSGVLKEAPGEQGLPFAALEFDEVWGILGMALFNVVDEPARVVVGDLVHGGMLPDAAEPIVAVGEVAFAPVHDAVPEGPGGVFE